MSAAALLRSEHINVLIFRYLQEAGFEDAATAFVTEWRRPPEHRDPESYPFAHAVQRGELVTVIQHGLGYDDILTRKCNKERKFNWLSVNAHDSIERRDGHLENGAASRPPSSKGRKGRPTAMRAPNEFPTPAPKRQRRSEGSEPHLNGDAMDVDAASASADADEDAEVASPAAQSEPEPLEVVERYDSMDVATQTEIKTSPKTSTMYLKVDSPGARIYSTAWSPNSDAKSAKTLLTVGESLCRFYQIPDVMDDAKQLSYNDMPSSASQSIVTASAWRPDGQGAAFAINHLANLDGGASTPLQSLIEQHHDGVNAILQFGPSLLEPPGIITNLTYSPNAEYLLVARTNMKRGLVQIWKTPRPDSDATTREPVAWRVFEDHITDVAWSEDDNFLVAGHSGLAAKYQVDASHVNSVGAVTAGTVALQGLIPHNSKIIDFTCHWDKVRFDARHRIMAFASIQSRKLVLAPELASQKAIADVHAEVDLPDALIALDFRPFEKSTDAETIALDRDSPTPSLLAAGFGDGSCMIFSISQSPEGRPKCSELVVLNVTDGPASAISWSPSGEQLAVGNSEGVQIWTSESLKRKNGVRHVPEASVSWKPASEPNGSIDVEQAAQQEDSDPSLSWSADGESLAFAADKQMAVIRFRPSFRSSSNDDAQDVDMNGGPSP